MVTWDGKMLRPIVCDRGETLSLCPISFLNMGKKMLVIYTAVHLAVPGWINLCPAQGIQCDELMLNCLFCWNQFQNVVWPSLFNLTIKGRLPGECSLIPGNMYCIISSVTYFLLMSEIPKGPGEMLLRPWDEKRDFAVVPLVALCSLKSSMGGPCFLRVWLCVWLCGYYFNIASSQHLPFFNLFCLVSYFISVWSVLTQCCF